MLEEFNTVTTSCLSMLSPLSSSSSSSASFTRPPPFEGNIIEAMPSSVWAEDEHWSEERVAAAQERLALQGKPLSSFFRDKFTLQADKFWRAFYVRNLNRFYKDRHYLHHIFPDLQREGHSVVVEVGCGVGNAALPLLEVNPSLRIVAIDFAESAINFLKANYSHETRLQVSESSPYDRSFYFLLFLFPLSFLLSFVSFHLIPSSAFLSLLLFTFSSFLSFFNWYNES